MGVNVIPIALGQLMVEIIESSTMALSYSFISSLHTEICHFRKDYVRIFPMYVQLSYWHIFLVSAAGQP